MTGVIILNKPTDFTSFDCVAVLRKILKEKKIGHTGTLDPMATGVLPMLIGKATKTANFLNDTDKEYEASFKFGLLTDTLDITGETKEEDDVKIAKTDLENVLEEFRGDILQMPPMYSAVSVNGQRLYTLARKGIEIEREKRPVTISKLELLSYDEEAREGKLLVKCTKGTYIRTLIDDIAMKLSSHGTLTALNRTFACGFCDKEAVSFDEIREFMKNGNIEEILKPIENLFVENAGIKVSSAQETRFLNGGALDLDRLKIGKKMREVTEPIKVYGESFLGLGKIDKEENELKILKIFKE